MSKLFTEFQLIRLHYPPSSKNSSRILKCCIHMGRIYQEDVCFWNDNVDWWGRQDHPQCLVFTQNGMKSLHMSVILVRWAHQLQCFGGIVFLVHSASND